MRVVVVVAALLAILGGATRAVGSGDQAGGADRPAIGDPARTDQVLPTDETPPGFSIRPLDDPS